MEKGKDEKKTIEMNEGTKRIITKSKRWKKMVREVLTDEYQREKANKKWDGEDEDDIMWRQQLREKRNGYKYQDLKKKKYNAEQFISEEEMEEVLKKSEMLCYYCGRGVMILYEAVRDGRQWTLDRIDNSKGHEKGNVVISCLACNLERRCQKSERYDYVQKLQVIKLGQDDVINN